MNAPHVGFMLHSKGERHEEFGIDFWHWLYYHDFGSVSLVDRIAARLINRNRYDRAAHVEGIISREMCAASPDRTGQGLECGA